jgi:hypothetical protein
MVLRVRVAVAMAAAALGVARRDDDEEEEEEPSVPSRQLRPPPVFEVSRARARCAE